MNKKKYGFRSGDLMIKPVDEENLWEEKWDIILVTNDNTRIGWFSFAGNKERGTIPIQIEIEPLYRHRGYGTASLKMIREWAFLHKDIFEIEAVVSNEDKETIHALERAGFIYREGLTVETGAMEKYSITRQKASWMGIYIIIGIFAGMILGITLGYIWVGLGVSIFLGIVLASYLDYQEKKWREKITGKKE